MPGRPPSLMLCGAAERRERARTRRRGAAGAGASGRLRLGREDQVELRAAPRLGHLATVGRGAGLVVVEGRQQRAAHAEHGVGVEVLVALVEDVGGQGLVAGRR